MRRLVRSLSLAVGATLIVAGLTAGGAQGSSLAPTPHASANRSASHLRGVVRAMGSAAAGRSSAAAALDPGRVRPLLGPSGSAVVVRRSDASGSSGGGPGSPAGGVRPRTPTPVGSGFDGLANANPILSPSDSTGALGDSWYLTAVNVRTSVYDTTGTQQFAPIRLRTLGGVLPQGAFEFDPKVVYDQYHHEFVLVFLANDKGSNFSKSWIVIATAPDATADNPNTWCVTRVAGDQYPQDGKQWADYPALGYTSNRVTLETNQFGFNRGFFGTQILSFPSSDLYDCDQGLRGKVFGAKATKNPDGSKSFTVQPAQTVGGTNPSVQYLLEFEYRGGGGEKVVLFRIKKTGKGLKLTDVQKKVGKAKRPFAATQKGGTLGNSDLYWDAGDLRLVNAAYDADQNRVYAAHAVRKDIAPSGYVEAAIRWYEVQPAGDLRSSSVTRKRIVGTSDRDSGWPVVATDTSGNLFIAYSRAGFQGGGGEYLSAHVAEVTPGGAVTDALLKSGEATYDFGPGPERWGDFNAIDRNPSNGAQVATIDQYAIDDGGGSLTQLWQQWVNLVKDS